MFIRNSKFKIQYSIFIFCLSERVNRWAGNGIVVIFKGVLIDDYRNQTNHWLSELVGGGDTPCGGAMPWHGPTVPSSVARRAMPWHGPTSSLIPSTTISPSPANLVILIINQNKRKVFCGFGFRELWLCVNFKFVIVCGLTKARRSPKVRQGNLQADRWCCMHGRWGNTKPLLLQRPWANLQRP